MKIRTTRRRIPEEGRLSRDAIKSRSDRIECFAQKMVEAAEIERSRNFAIQWDHAASFDFLQTSFPAPCNVAHFNARLVSRPVSSGHGVGGGGKRSPGCGKRHPRARNFLAKDHFGFSSMRFGKNRAVSCHGNCPNASRFGNWWRGWVVVIHRLAFVPDRLFGQIAFQDQHTAVEVSYQCAAVGKLVSDEQSKMPAERNPACHKRGMVKPRGMDNIFSMEVATV